MSVFSNSTRTCCHKQIRYSHLHHIGIIQALFLSTSILFRFCIQGWISVMGIDGPTFVPKSGYFLPILVKVFPQKLAFYNFWPILRAGFFDKMLALSNKKSTIVLISGFLAVIFAQFFSKII